MAVRITCRTLLHRMSKHMSIHPGLFNFTWHSETSLAFVSPCHLDARTYATVSVTFPDGRVSAMPRDVEERYGRSTDSK